MLLNEEVRQTLGKDGPLTAEELSKKINLHKSVLEFRHGKDERKMFKSFKLYLEAMVEYKEVNYDRKKEVYNL